MVARSAAAAAAGSSSRRPPRPRPTALLALAGVHKLGTAGVLLPLGLALVVILISRPRVGGGAWCWR